MNFSLRRGRRESARNRTLFGPAEVRAEGLGRRKWPRVRGPLRRPRRVPGGEIGLLLGSGPGGLRARPKPRPRAGPQPEAA
ncbi:hypothetical protein NDU88_000274 [Pleurodeles waltl]|uniref:Uncharacterized protein n=1 Tax=Pleurodeles waltl TaxID=8319 RepID=A0AAV7V8H5_PLEWA|nr:hypothetical protein NDU88_000274 [Pleurodeles waltl]